MALDGVLGDDAGQNEGGDDEQAQAHQKLGAQASGDASSLSGRADHYQCPNSYR
ncbi:hypothetical protein [Persicimonas caeni]|uniref:hypothetical protein n=1 Tax=Persicimonas caeni TaxID=2292766 RepID=UPI00143D8C44|nr:hypothetical protein [Persicimonas caeni]